MQPVARQVILEVGLAVLSLASSQAQTNGNWTFTGTTAANLSWGFATSWSTSPNIPNAIGATANFTANLTAAKINTLNGDRTVGTMKIDDPTTSSVGIVTLGAANDYDGGTLVNAARITTSTATRAGSFRRVWN